MKIGMLYLCSIWCTVLILVLAFIVRAWMVAIVVTGKTVSLAFQPVWFQKTDNSDYVNDEYTQYI